MIMKKMMVTIGYNDYALERLSDAVDLMDIFSRAARLERKGYSGPYFPHRDQEPAVTTVSLVEIDARPEKPEPSTDNAEDPVF
jgi:hypothetical protein